MKATLTLFPHPQPLSQTWKRGEIPLLPYLGFEVIPIHENPDTNRFLVGAWQCHALTNVFVSLLK